MFTFQGLIWNRPRPPNFCKNVVERSKMGATKNFKISFHLAHIVTVSLQNDPGLTCLTVFDSF